MQQTKFRLSGGMKQGRKPPSSYPRMMLSFLQINLHHSSAVTHILSGQLTVEQTNIALIQEPWAFKRRVIGLGGGQGTVFYCTSVE
jgi:hypothetical protein